MFKQGTGYEVKALAVFGEKLTAAILGLRQDPADFGVYKPGRVGGVVFRLHHVGTKKDRSTVGQRHGSDRRTHSPFGDHEAGDAGCLSKVVGSSRGELVEYHRFRHSPSHGHDHASLRLGFVECVAIFGGERHGHAEGHAGGNDRDLVDGIVVVLHRRAQGVASFVVGRALQVLWALSY